MMPEKTEPAVTLVVELPRESAAAAAFELFTTPAPESAPMVIVGTDVAPV